MAKLTRKQILEELQRAKDDYEYHDNKLELARTRIAVLEMMLEKCDE